MVIVCVVGFFSLLFARQATRETPQGRISQTSREKNDFFMILIITIRPFSPSPTETLKKPRLESLMSYPDDKSRRKEQQQFVKVGILSTSFDG